MAETLEKPGIGLPKVDVKVAYIDNKPFELVPGETILSFLRRYEGQDSVPTLCDAPNLKPFGFLSGMQRRCSIT